MMVLPPVDVVAQPLTVNLDVYQGDDFYLDLTVTDSVGNPVNMAGWVAAAVVRAAPGTRIVATFTCNVDTVNTNVLHLLLPHSEAMNLQRKGVWDCQVTQLSGTILTLVAGSVSAGLQVTV
jgi:hypothetical protein